MAESGLQRGWDFTPSEASRYDRRERIKDFAFRLRPAPRTRVLRAARGAGAWTLYFMYLPDGAMTAAHRYTLDRLAEQGRKLLLVCAAATPEAVPAEAAARADALLWKGLSGYDFSAYAAGLRHIAAQAPGSDVLVLNDSIVGPFSDLAPLAAQARWDLTGFTGSTFRENHIQSYAFFLRGVTRRRLWQLRSVFVPGAAFRDFESVVRSQETRLARVAARRMSVGALWFAADRRNEDPTRFSADALLDEGFPFVKKSLFGKYRHVGCEHELTALEARLRALGHPPLDALSGIRPARAA